ncbi:MAG: hypothetical protein CL608_24155 [Anaerolineaceae bacterium]|nr:hypothetical protein [Anaerolineaceae bacterium]
MSQLPARYNLGEKIGEGAMGEVYKAYDTQTERDVAIKMLPASALHGPHRERFKREARTIAHLEHPSVVPLYDFNLPDNDDETPFLVMRYMTGGSLADKIRQGRLSVDEVVQITRRIGRGLDAAHKRGLVHRDIKPGNILLDEDGYSYLADFGIVMDPTASLKLTQHGQPGTAPYMSPEQIKGEELDGRSDIYALGVVTFEMLTGALPFGGSLQMIFEGHLNEAVPSVFSFVDDLPEEVDDVLHQALAKNPKDRLHKAEHLAELFEAALQSPSVYERTRNLLADTAETASDWSIAASPTELLVDTKPSRVLSDTIKTPSFPNWRLLAGGFGVVLLILLAFWGADLLDSGVAGPTAVFPQTVRTNPQAEQLVSEPTGIEEDIEPTAVTDFIAVLQQADSAIWQSGDDIQRIPENGRVPFQPPLFFQSSNEPVRLLLPNLVSIILDTNTSLWIESAAVDDTETVLRLEEGRLLIESQTSSVRVYHEAGFQAEMMVGTVGVAYVEDSARWEVDCLLGACQLGPDEKAEPFDLAEGQYSAILPDAVITTPSPARYNAYTNLASNIPQPSSTPTDTPVPVSATTPTSAATWTSLPVAVLGSRGPETTVLGQSAAGQEIAVTRLGNGPQTLLLVGGIHSGYAPNSVQLGRAMVTYFSQNLTDIPSNVTLYIIVNLNPDAISAPGELAGRLNANGVDLNRNWDCRWDPNPTIFGETREGAGGTAVLSEPETALLNSFIEQVQPDAVLIWGAGQRTNGAVSPGACEVRSLVSVGLVPYYATAAGHEFLDKPEVLANPDLTGDMTNWLDKIGIPAIYVILPGFQEVDFARELEGVLSVLTAVSAPEKFQQTPTPMSCQLPVNPAWEAIYEQHRLRLGCPESGVNLPVSVWQPFEHGRMLWRQDTDTVYALYNDGTMNSFLVNDPSLGDFRESDLIKGAIGYVWRNNAAVSQKLGQPQDQERQAADVNVQDFSSGFIISWRENNLQTNLIFLEVNQWQTP